MKEKTPVVKANEVVISREPDGDHIRWIISMECAGDAHRDCHVMRVWVEVLSRHGAEGS